MSEPNARTARSASLDGISAANQVRLLSMSHDRLFFSVNAIPFVGIPFLAWLWLLGRLNGPFITWFTAYVVAALLFRLLRRHWQQDRALLTAKATLTRWTPRVYRIALVHGLGLSSSIAMTWGSAPLEYNLLLTISVAAIVAANSAHLTPNFSTFQRFFFTSWGGLLLSIPLVFPTLWGYVLPLALLYALAMYRYALSSHKFFLNQVKLEERESKLAEKFRHAKEQAEKALQDKNHFLAAASHDLRQPIHAMGFLIEAIIRRDSDPTLNRLMMELRQCVHSATAMFDSLLDLSRIENGRVSIACSPVKLAPIFGDMYSMFREEAFSRSLRLCVRQPPADAIVMGDEILIRRALVNLIHNALRYTESGGVLIAARRRAGDWLVEVWDTGVGIADEEQEKIYSEYYRNEYAWRIDNAGHGLGLAVVARCATLMGTQHGMTSRQGRGSRFWLRLPGAMREPVSADSTAACTPLPAAALNAGTLSLTAEGFGSLRGNCLVIDDDPLVSRAWQRLMTAWGVEVRCCASSAETFALLKQGFIPQAILCDQRLRSGESGVEILAALLNQFPQASGAMVSGEFNSPALMKAQDNGYLVLHKPLPPAQLHDLLSQWL